MQKNEWQLFKMQKLLLNFVLVSEILFDSLT